MEIIIISGRSGAGKSVALRALEDIGYYCVDNLPIDLLPHFADILAPNQSSVAISIDIRNLPNNPAVLESLLAQLRQQHQIKIIFLDTDSTTLIRRYSDSRRLHPLQCRIYP